MSSNNTRSTLTSANSGALVALGPNKEIICLPDKAVAKLPHSARKSSPKEKKYFSFELRNLPDEHIEGKEEADAFRKDYSDIIVKTHAYANLNYWESFKARRKKFFESTPRTPPPKKSSDDTDTKLMLQKMSGLRQVEMFQGFYRTNSRASKFILFFKWIGIQGDDYWCWKPKLMVPALTSYFDVRHPQDEVIRRAFATLEYAPRPDPNDRETGQVVVFSPDSGRSYDIPIFTTYAIFDIPVKNLSSFQEEAQWIEHTCSAFFEEMRSAMKEKCFKSLLLELDERFTTKLYDPKKVTNLTKFLDKAVVKVVPIDTMATHVITSVAGLLTQQLWSSRMPVTKYSTTCAPPLEGTAPINRDTITETADDPNQKLPDEGNDDVGGSEEERSNRDDSEGAVSDVDE
jgi:hypothetical protein